MRHNGNDVFDLKLQTFTLEDLVGRRVEIIKYEDANGTAISAKDINTGDTFLLTCETKNEREDSHE